MLTITTSFHWGESRNCSNHQYMLRFDVEEMVKEWLVSGRKRGDFSATVCDYHRQTLSRLTGYMQRTDQPLPFQSH
jgi:hypothetical protein